MTLILLKRHCIRLATQPFGVREHERKLGWSYREARVAQRKCAWHQESARSTTGKHEWANGLSPYLLLVLQWLNLTKLNWYQRFMNSITIMHSCVFEGSWRVFRLHCWNHDQPRAKATRYAFMSLRIVTFSTTRISTATHINFHITENTKINCANIFYVYTSTCIYRFTFQLHDNKLVLHA